MKGWWGRYRPYILVVAAVGLLVLPLADRDDPAEVATDVPSAAGDTPGPAVDAGPPLVGRDAPAAPAGAGDVAAGVGGPGSPVPKAGAATGGRPSPSPAGGAAATAVGTTPRAPAATGGFPGIRSPEALAGPKCDSATGRLRFPSRVAPECVRPWPPGADNGGATASGVTKDTIKLVIYDNSDAQERNGYRKLLSEFLDIFNHHYELWGRKVEVVFFEKSGDDEVAQRADAVKVAAMKPFMATTYTTFGSPTPTVWATELASRGVISWDPSTYFEETHAQPGLRWGSHDNRLSAIVAGEYVGKRLLNRPAKWAGDVAMRTQTRKFGLIYDKFWDRAAFEAEFARYGGRVSAVGDLNPRASPVEIQNRSSTLMAKMKDAGVNNIINATNVVFNAVVTRAATQQNYRPEWTLTGWGSTDTSIGGQLADQTQMRHAFGVGFTPIQLSDSKAYDYSRIYEWEYGRAPDDLTLLGMIWQFAKSALAGIQLAGPNLTPKTFAAALASMEPKQGAFCRCVTTIGLAFGRHLEAYPWEKYAANSDVAEKWYDPDTVGANEIGLTAPGLMQFVDGGRRYLPGQIPTGEPDVFNPANKRSSYRPDELPASDKDPTYPHPDHA